MQSQHLEFLKGLGVHTQRHTGRTFLEHLQGTYALLKTWDCDEAVCLAGLFHSVYGTNTFKTSSLPLKERQRVRDIIGENAEYLSFLFCVSNRPTALLAAIESGKVKHRLDNSEIEIDTSIVTQLLEIECANLIEQASGKQFFPQLMHKMAVGEIAIKPNIANAIQQYIHVPDGKGCAYTEIAVVELQTKKIPLSSPSKSLILRFANKTDIDQILWLARELHVDSRYAWLPFQKDKIRKQLEAFLEDSKNCCIVVTRNDDLISFLLGSLEDMPFAKAKAAVCRFLYVTHKARGLLALKMLHGFRHWAKRMDAQEVRLDDSFGETIERSEMLFQRIGLVRTGGIYAMQL